MAFMKKLACGASIAALAALAPVAAVHAQETASQLRGVVTDADGSPVAGARLTITHVPTGAVSSAVSSGTGSFTQGGLRVGGPYNITISAPGYDGEALEGLNLQPGTNPQMRIRLAPATTEVITVTGQAISGTDLNSGVGSSFSARDIANQPSLNRDVVATLSRDPLAISGGPNNLSVAGVNPRFNGVTIDGARQQDNFGLGTNTFATSRSPINIDIIESVQLVASDYSVTASGFTGGLVNVTTRGGTNELDGSLFYYYRDQDWIGDETFGGEGSFSPGEFEEKEYGITLRGPIIRDRLFFSLSYDRFETASQVDFTGQDQNNSVDPRLFDELNRIVLDTYGIDMGGRPQQTAIPNETERWFARIDWDINNDHRLQLTYQKTEDTGVSNVGSNNFVSAWYDTPQTLENYTLQLFSDWTPNLSTTLRGSFIDNVRGQNCRADADVGTIFIQLNRERTEGTPLEGLVDTNSLRSFTGGCDRFRHANEFEDNRIQLFASADYTMGDFLHTGGVEFERYDPFNLFVDTSRGEYRFANAQDLLDGRATVNYRNVTTNNAQDGAADWSYDRWSAFGQTRWQARPDLELSAGLRFEYYSQDDVPQEDPSFAADVGTANTKNLDGLGILLPRLSFRYEPFSRTTITGGVGRFTGGAPEVWVSNAFQAPTVFASGTFDNVSLTQSGLPQPLLNAVASGTAGAIDAIDPNFKLPSDWKASIRVDQEFDMVFGGFDLGRDYLASVQLLYSQSEDAYIWRNLSQLRNEDALPTGVAPDGRPIYADLQALGEINRTILTNASGDNNYTLTVSLENEFDNGFGFYASYAHQSVEFLAPGSSRGISSWRGQTVLDRNFPVARTSDFQVDHSFKIGLSYERDFIPDLFTRVDLFGQITSGSTYTITYDTTPSNALFGRAGAGESPFANNPLYIPLRGSDSRVVYGSGFDIAGFEAYLDDTGVARGKPHEVNSLTGPWQQRWDLRLQQDLPGIPGAERFFGDNRFKLVLDIENVLNLINSDWGTTLNPPGNNQLPQVQADLVRRSDVATLGIDDAPALTGDLPRTACVTRDACVYRYNEFNDRSPFTRNNAQSVWYARAGIRYEF